MSLSVVGITTISGTAIRRLGSMSKVIRLGSIGGSMPMHIVAETTLATLTSVDLSPSPQRVPLIVRRGHQKGCAGNAQDKGGEKGDARNPVVGSRPKNWKGPCPVNASGRYYSGCRVGGPHDQCGDNASHRIRPQPAT